jgi:small-conductance mechanosensitive channel
LPDFIKHWLADPVVRKFAASLVAVVVIIILVRLIKNYAFRLIKDSNSRYRARKLLVLIGYVAGIVTVASIFSSKLGGLTIAFGVAGAGIAFALQEVIASVAGWLAISAGNFYKPGDRIQLGGIMGDVIDIGVLRTTLMECRQWVKGDQYNGCIVRVANSCVFKEPVFNYTGDFHRFHDPSARLVAGPGRERSEERAGREGKGR